MLLRAERGHHALDDPGACGASSIFMPLGLLELQSRSCLLLRHHGFMSCRYTILCGACLCPPSELCSFRRLTEVFCCPTPACVALWRAVCATWLQQDELQVCARGPGKGCVCLGAVVIVAQRTGGAGPVVLDS